MAAPAARAQVHPAAWQLGDPRTRRDRPGTVFRIGADERRRVVAQLAAGWQTDGTARGARRVRCDLAAIARCLGAVEPRLPAEVLRAPMMVTIDAVAVETALAPLDPEVRAVADRLELGEDGRTFVVEACTLARAAWVALPRPTAEALCGRVSRSRHVTWTEAIDDAVKVRLALDRPEPIAFAVAEIVRAPAGLSLVPVDAVLRWSWEPHARAAAPDSVAGGEPPRLASPPGPAPGAPT